MVRGVFSAWGAYPHHGTGANLKVVGPCGACRPRAVRPVPCIAIIVVDPTVDAPETVVKGTFLNNVSGDSTVDTPIRPPIPKDKVTAGDGDPRYLPQFVLSQFFSTFTSGYFVVLSGPFVFLDRSGVFLVGGEVGNVNAEFPECRVVGT